MTPRKPRYEQCKSLCRWGLAPFLAVAATCAIGIGWWTHSPAQWGTGIIVLGVLGGLLWMDRQRHRGEPFTRKER
jgi:hypothetical protein